MVHFTQFDPVGLSYSSSQCMPHGMRVTPFGCPRINGYVLLPGAFRSLSRPSSPCSSIGIRHGPIFRLTILFFPHTKNYFLSAPRPFSCQAHGLKARLWHAYLHSEQHNHLCHLSFFFPSLRMSNIRSTQTMSETQRNNKVYSLFMEIRGLEPLTLGLQSRCSSQLS